MASVYRRAINNGIAFVVCLFCHASSYASAVLAVVILFVARVLCDKTKQCTADILIPHERAITLVL